MRILLDACVPRPLRREFPDHDAAAARRRKFCGLPHDRPESPLPAKLTWPPCGNRGLSTAYRNWCEGFVRTRLSLQPPPYGLTSRICLGLLRGTRGWLVLRNPTVIGVDCGPGVGRTGANVKRFVFVRHHRVGSALCRHLPCLLWITARQRSYPSVVPLPPSDPALSCDCFQSCHQGSLAFSPVRLM